jgi:sucrose phosphorylase
MRPAEGILPEDGIRAMIDTVRRHGGLVSMRALPGGGEAPYELNVTFYDALRGTVAGEDGWHFDRYIASQTIVMALEGIPAFYIHALLGTGNDLDGVAKTGVNRAINRHRWHYPDLQAALADPASTQARVLAEMKRRLALRGRQPAFHPNATQFTLQLEDRVFGIWRQSLDRDQSIFALHNVSDREVLIDPVSVNLIDGAEWTDLLSGETMPTIGAPIRLAPYQCRWISNRN